jgi:hypothetical protein
VYLDRRKVKTWQDMKLKWLSQDKLTIWVEGEDMVQGGRHKITTHGVSCLIAFHFDLF